MKIKGSDLGREYSLANLEKQIETGPDHSLKPVRVKEKKPGKKRGIRL